jgi:hypothetical protein
MRPVWFRAGPEGTVFLPHAPRALGSFKAAELRATVTVSTPCTTACAGPRPTDRARGATLSRSPPRNDRTGTGPLRPPIAPLTFHETMRAARATCPRRFPPNFQSDPGEPWDIAAVLASRRRPGMLVRFCQRSHRSDTRSVMHTASLDPSAAWRRHANRSPRGRTANGSGLAPFAGGVPYPNPPWPSRDCRDGGSNGRTRSTSRRRAGGPARCGGIGRDQHHDPARPTRLREEHPLARAPP